LIIRITGACEPLSSRSSAGGQVLHQPGEIAVAREIVGELRGLGPRGVVGARKLGGEALGVDRARSQRPLQHAFQLAMPSTVASGRVSTTICPLSSPCASTPCVRANAYGMRCA
jgi:hypothetical protein